MMRRGFYDDHHVLKTIALKPSVRMALGAGGVSLKIAEDLEDLPLSINGVIFRCPTVTVVDDLVYDGILGRDFNCKHRTIVDDNTGTIMIGGMIIPLPSREQVRPRRARVRLVSTVTVPARSECVVFAKLERIDGKKHDETGMQGIFEPAATTERERLLTPRVLVAADGGGNVPIILTNFGTE